MVDACKPVLSMCKKEDKGSSDILRIQNPQNAHRVKAARASTSSLHRAGLGCMACNSTTACATSASAPPWRTATTRAMAAALLSVRSVAVHGAASSALSVAGSAVDMRGMRRAPCLGCCCAAEVESRAAMSAGCSEASRCRWPCGGR